MTMAAACPLLSWEYAGKQAQATAEVEAGVQRNGTLCLLTFKATALTMRVQRLTMFPFSLGFVDVRLAKKSPSRRLPLITSKPVSG